ncbi:MAG: phosphatase PAP2 family protein [Rikenellaceae bacterium]
MKYLALIILLSITLQTSAQVTTERSVADDGSTYNGFFHSKAFDMLHVGVPLAAVGLAFKPANDEFKAMRDDNLYFAHTAVDDYLQYAPAALMLGLKASGVESRSSWGRMLTADAISVAVVTLSVKALKYSTSVKRPDTAADNSFPSGHTATAFMTATMLHKEYGARSYWYSVAGYSAASATGLMRMINNRHWISDVMVGAALGILSTEVGYLLSDMIFKDRGINYDLDESSREPSWHSINSPSSVGLYLGVALPVGRTSKRQANSTYLASGCRVGLEGQFNIDGNFGIASRLSMTNSPVKVDGVTQSDEFSTVSGDIGCYYARPVTDRWRVGAKLLGGVNYYGSYSVTNDDLYLAKGVRGGFGTGFSMEYLSNRHWSMKAFCDYDAAYLKELPDTNLHQTMVVGFIGSVIF